MVNCAGKHALAGTAFPGNEDGGFAGGDAFDEPLQLLHGNAGENWAVQTDRQDVIARRLAPPPPGAGGRVAGDEVVYNKIAREVMAELNVPVDDLGAYVAEQQKKLPPYPVSERAKARDLARSPRHGEIQKPFDVHFTPEGYNQLANLVVASIDKVLPAAH